MKGLKLGEIICRVERVLLKIVTYIGPWKEVIALCLSLICWKLNVFLCFGLHFYKPRPQTHLIRVYPVCRIIQDFQIYYHLKAVTASIDSLGWAFLLAAGFKSRNCIWFSWRKSEYTQASEAIILLMPLTPEFRLNFNRIILIFTISSWRRTWWGPACPGSGTWWSLCSSTSGSWPHSPSTWPSSWGSQSSTKSKHQTQTLVSNDKLCSKLLVS